MKVPLNLLWHTGHGKRTEAFSFMHDPYRLSKNAKKKERQARRQLAAAAREKRLEEEAKQAQAQAQKQAARDAECCKVTLEVRADNLVARQLYVKCGFEPGHSETSAMSFWSKKLDG